MNKNNVWLPNLPLLSQQTGLYGDLQEEGRASCQLHKSDSFNMLNFMSATVLTAHAIISAVNSQNNNNNNNNNNNSRPSIQYSIREKYNFIPNNK